MSAADAARFAAAIRQADPRLRSGKPGRRWTNPAEAARDQAAAARAERARRPPPPDDPPLPPLPAPVLPPGDVAELARGDWRRALAAIQAAQSRQRLITR